MKFINLTERNIPKRISTENKKYVVISSECPACRKTKKQIEKFFKEGKSVSLSEAARKAKALGLPTKI